RRRYGQLPMKEIWRQDPAVLHILRRAVLRPDKRCRRSLYAVPFEEGGAGYIYNVLTRQCVEGSLPPDRLYSAREIGADPDLLFLAENRYLVPEDADECGTYEGLLRILRAMAKSGGLTSCTILPTMKCNARCLYCFEEGRRETSMSPETVDDTIAYILRTARKDGAVKLHWFGGEPLLRPDIIDRICGRLREEGLRFYSTVTTNGSLLTESLADRLAGPWNVKSVQISMDGCEDEYIRRKNYAVYRDYYHAVPANVRLLTDRDIRVSVRVNTDGGNADGLPRFLEELADMIPDKRLVTVYFSLLTEARLKPEAAGTMAGLLRADSLLDSAGFRRDYAHPGHFRLHRCMADNPSESVAVSPDGLLYPCEVCEPGTSFGSVAEGVTDRALFDRFNEPERPREKCRACPLLPECTPFSGCPIRDADCRGLRYPYLVRSLKHIIKDKAFAAASTEDERND
ncbi:MAG: radical SAM protein, partial [Abditibacteriota bacterium]|nr:radical SAM protein [Abditibacteriota bacterium]